MEQWICNEVAACGSKWSGVALSTEPVTSVPSVRSAKKRYPTHKPINSQSRGSIWRCRGTSWRSSVSNAIRKYVLRVS